MKPISGIGIGLRNEFCSDLETTSRSLDWLEIVPENWIQNGGKFERTLEAMAERWPLVPHSVSLNLGGLEPLDGELIDAVDSLCTKFGCPFWSDHISYARIDGVYLHDLLPLPFNAAAAEWFVGRAREVQSRLSVPLVLENPTYYAVMPGSDMTELDFLRLILRESGCNLLLDVNNVYVNSQNLSFDAHAFIDGIPMDKVSQIHLAGHVRRHGVIKDSHRGPVPDPVWNLYRYTIQRAGRVIPTLIEWDTDIPPLDVILDDVDMARAIANSTLMENDHVVAAVL